MTTLVRSFASVFLDLPHRTTRNYKALLKSIGPDIFNKEHKLEPYYIAAFSQYRLEYLFRSQVIGRDLKAARYHLLMCFRHLATDGLVPPFNSKRMVTYCNNLMAILWDDHAYTNVFSHAEKIIRTVAEGNLHRDNIRTEPFTKKILDYIKAERVAPKSKIAT